MSGNVGLIHSGLTSMGIKSTDMLTQDNKDEIEIMYYGGWNPEDIADELGLDETEVMDFCADEL